MRIPACPDCPYHFAHREPITWADVPWLFVLLRPYRCDCCGERYFASVIVMPW